MADQNNDGLDETDRLKQDIAREFEEAFANVSYPGDDKIVDNPDYYENDKIFEAFRGKHWKEINLEMLFWHRQSLHRLSPEGFRFFFPCFMVGALLHSEETDTLWQSMFYDLTPPASEGPRMDWFLNVVNLLDARQKAAVRRYVELYVQIETSLPDPSKERALSFWRRITEPEA